MTSMFDETDRSLRNRRPSPVSDQLSSADRLGELLRQLASGNLDPAATVEDVLRFARTSAGDFARSLVGLAVEFHRARLDLGRQYSNELMDRLLGTARPATMPAIRSAEIVLTGPIGGEVSAPFAIDNEQATFEDISFVVSEFTDLAGQAPFRPPLTLDPPRLTLGPGEEGVVTLRLPLLGELFIPGRLYRATVTVSGHDLELVLHALAYDTGTTTVPPAGGWAAEPTEAPAAAVSVESIGTAPAPEPTDELALEASEELATEPSESARPADGTAALGGEDTGSATPVAGATRSSKRRSGPRMDMPKETPAQTPRGKRAPRAKDTQATRATRRTRRAPRSAEEDGREDGDGAG